MKIIAVEYCVFCPYHIEPESGYRYSYCKKHDKYFDYDGVFPIFCELKEIERNGNVVNENNCS